MELNDFLQKNNILENQLKEVAALRYISYLDNQSIDGNAEKMFYDEFDMRRNCYSYIEYIDGIPAATIRACVYDPSKIVKTIPAMEIFSEEIAKMAGKNQVIVESNKFVIHPRFQRKGLRLKFDLFGFIFNLALQVNATYIIGAVRKEHAKFYQQMNFRIISDAKRYPGLSFDTILMANNFNTSTETYLDLPDKIKARLNIQPLAA
jgi:hypothetical protein